MCHPQVIRSRQRMKHDGGKTAQLQGNGEDVGGLPRHVMECASIRCSLASRPFPSTILIRYPASQGARSPPMDTISGANSRALSRTSSDEGGVSRPLSLL